MTLEELRATYLGYNHAVYLACKWTLTIPATLLGNGIDLCTLGVTKNLIDVTPVMTQFPFFKKLTHEKEQGYANSNFMNKGVGGFARATVSIVGELPFSFVAAVIGAVLTALHILISHTIGVPIAAIAEFAYNNMFGCS